VAAGLGEPVGAKFLADCVSTESGRASYRAPYRRSIDAVQVRGVVADHWSRLVFGDAGEILADSLDRKWEGALGVRIVRSPHQPIHAEQMARQDAEPVILEGRPELALEVSTGRFMGLRLHPAMAILPPVIHEAQLRGDPSDAAFDDHEAQFRKTLRHGRCDQ